jgi:hypothetical protein
MDYKEMTLSDEQMEIVKKSKKCTHDIIRVLNGYEKAIGLASLAEILVTNSDLTYDEFMLNMDLSFKLLNAGEK